MAECTIGEYPSGPPNGMQLVKGSTCLARQVLNVGGASSPSQAFGGNTRSVRVWTDTKMAFRFGPAGQAVPIAIANDEGMSAGQTEYFSVEPGDFFAVIAIP
jgi:hypothetical protein